MEGVEPPPTESKNVYEQWRDFDFEDSLSSFQSRYETIVTNISNSADEKRELVVFVKEFTTKVQKQDTCDRKDIEKVLGFFKAFFARLLERSSLAEEGFQQLYSRFGQLPNPTPVLLNAMIVSSENNKLETQVRAAEHLQSSHEESQTRNQEQQKLVESLRENLDKTMLGGRELETAIEIKNREITQLTTQLQQQRDVLTVLETRNDDLSNHLSTIQQTQLRETEISQEENLRQADTITELQSELDSLRQQTSPTDTSIKQNSELESQLNSTELQLEEIKLNLTSVLTDKTSLESLVEVKNEEIKQLKISQHNINNTHSRSLKTIRDMGIETSLVDEGGDIIQVVLTLEKKRKDVLNQLRDKTEELIRMEATTDKLIENIKNLTTSLTEKEEHLITITQQLGSIKQGGDDFNFSSLIQQESGIPSAPGSEAVALLTSQREQLKDKVTLLEKQRNSTICELDNLKRAVKLQNVSNNLITCVSSSKPSSQPSAAQPFRSSFDSFAFQLIKQINSNAYTRILIVSYVGVLHFLVFAICYYVAYDYKSVGKNSF